MIKKIFVLTVFLCVFYVSHAQNPPKPKSRLLEGFVAEMIHHSQDTSFIQGVRIYLEGSSKYVQTDMNGAFTLEIPDSTVTAKIELFGYRNKTIEIASGMNSITILMERNGGFMEDEGWLITVVGMMVVFGALLVLFTLFKFLMPFFLVGFKKKSKREQVGIAQSTLKSGEISGEVVSAISASLHLYFGEMHDEESGVLTIEKTVKNYSPWSSKIYMNYKTLRSPQSSRW